MMIRIPIEMNELEEKPIFSIPSAFYIHTNRCSGLLSIDKARITAYECV